MIEGLEPGALIAGRYRVERALSDKGGMGAVYLAVQASTESPCVLKILRPQLVGNHVARDRFEQEAKAAARVTGSDHVVRMIDAGVDEGRGLLWIAMELLDGEDLDARVTREGALPAKDVLEIFRQLCHALGKGHRAGVVHCDLKPENIFLAKPKRAGAGLDVKLLDFGIARVLREGDTSVTGGPFIGTCAWMAPEQMGREGARISPRTDVWALGLISFYLLTGRHYQRLANASEDGAGPFQVAAEMMLNEADPPSMRAKELGLAGELPPGFDLWFLRCVSRDDKARYGDADEAFAAMEQALREVAPPERPGEAVRGAAASPPAEPPGERRSGRRRGYVVALLALMIWGLSSRLPWRQAVTAMQAKCPADMVLVAGASGGGSVGGREPFCIGRDEVTVGRFERCAADGSCPRDQNGALIPGQAEGVARSFDVFCNAGRAGRSRHPMNCVDWDAARAFCRSQGGDLPTEEQWERAAHGVSGGGVYPWGSDARMVGRMNGCGRECAALLRMSRVLYDAEDGYGATAPVGSFPQGDTPSGLRDMAGNVSEWTLGRGRGDSVLRGSGWIASDPIEVRVAARRELDRQARLPFAGIRCVTQVR